MIERHPVFFNNDQYKNFKKLRKDGFTSQKFPEFVKAAFYERLDSLRASRLDLSKETIKKLADDVILKATKKISLK